MKKILSLYFAALFALSSFAQVSTIPVFPAAGANDSVTVIYDASQGNAALLGVSPVYMHAGVITNLSQNPSDWRYVVTTWGVANDPDAQMTSLGNNRWQKRYHLRNFYGVPQGETILQMAFVFRNATGTIVGRTAAGGDIYATVYDGNAALLTTFLSPTGNNLLYQQGAQIPIDVAASVNSTITLYDNGVQLAQTNGTSLQYNLTVNTPGDHLVRAVADDGVQTAVDSFVYVVPNPNNVQNPPAGLHQGINYIGNDAATLLLWAPNKDYVFLLGDFNNWTLSTDWQMNLSADGNTWWYDLSGLTPGQNYAFQYFVDGTIKIADPYSELVLDPGNDPFIPAVTFPNLPAYPTGSTTGIVSVLQPGAPQYTWQTGNFTAPDKKDLVVYELLLRDFIARHDYATLLDTLDYLVRLGVNAIQLMPVNEFEGNISWGYNPSFHMALDKYYGTKNDFKAFIDACHDRGIAVVLDVVYNHLFSQSPLCRLYWDDANFRPTVDNPWVNVTARHPFNVGYDLNHESQATRDYLDHVMQYWIEEYRVDGFRFDLSKGFTQTNTGNDVGLWGQYDQSRIDNIERLADVCWAANPNFYMILEHFADNWEEIALSNYGCLFWGNANCAYSQAAMGYPTGPCNWDFNWGVNYQARGWGNPNLVGYMESHDEERVMFKNLSFGNAAGAYDIKSLTTALARIELSACLFFTVPGPKMIWQFGEVGYDKTIELCQNGQINAQCRTDPKPILWNYYAQPARRHVYDVFSALIRIKKDYPVFETSNYTTNLGGSMKSIILSDPTMNAVAVGNFGVITNSTSLGFQHTGWWYDFFTGDSLNVANVPFTLVLNPGEYRLYTDQKLPAPVFTGVENTFSNSFDGMVVFPNPSDGLVHFQYSLPQGGQMELAIYDLSGKKVAVVATENQMEGEYMLSWTPAQQYSGVYVARLTVDGRVLDVKMLEVKN